MSNEYYPPKPLIGGPAQNMSCPPPDKCDCQKPWAYPWSECPPPPPPPPCPNKFNPCPPPGLRQIPPIPSVVEGQSLYEAMNTQIERTNACIAQWNCISANCYAAMNACVEAARSNDVYYDDYEVHYETGYDQNEGCTYSIIKKRPVDRNGQPIFTKLMLAFDNTTNSGVTQDIFDVSFIKSANVVMTAVAPAQDNWNGPALYRGAPIPGTTTESGYVYGFNRQGWLRYFNYDVDSTTLIQNGMVDVIGGCVPLLSDSELTTEAQNLTTKANIYALGFNKGTGDLYFFSCSAYDQPGMSGVSVAKLLQGYGCDTAVATSIVEASNQNISGGMLYMAQMTTVPQGGRSPSNLAYWVISKRPNFNNCFQKEIADLVQTTGQNAWKTYLLGASIKSFDQRIIDNYNLITAETARAEAAEKTLQDNINVEEDRATQAEDNLQANINAEQTRAEEAEEMLQENINAEADRAKLEETALDNKIEAETTRAEAAENALTTALAEETSRAKTAENKNAADIAAETLRAQTKENTIQANLDDEVTKRIAADNDIINAIEQEVLARRAADTALQNNIDAVNNKLTGDIQAINTQLDSINSGTKVLPYLPITGGELTGDTMFAQGNTLTLGRGPTTDLEAATKKYVDDAVAAGGGGGTGGDVTKEYVDEQVATLQGQITGKLDKAGGTMTGTLNMSGNSIENPVLSSSTGITVNNGNNGAGTITNLAVPTNDSDAVNKAYVDTATSALDDKIEAISGEVGADYLPKAGGTMTGDIEMVGSSVINFYDPEATTAAMQKRAVSSTGFKPSKIAQQFGITDELLKTAENSGLQMRTASIADVLDANGISPQAVAGQALKGSVYNDGDDMCIKSESGGIGLKGTKVTLSDGAGNNIPLEGATTVTATGEISAGSVTSTGDITGGTVIATGGLQIGSAATKGIITSDNFGTLSINNGLKALNGVVRAQSLISTGTATVTNGLTTGSAVIGGHTLQNHTVNDIDHLDINVSSSQGAVYVNRTNNGSPVDGGTGEIHVTQIHAPNELQLVPGTNINAGGKRITNVGAPTQSTDVARLGDIAEAGIPSCTSFGGNARAYGTPTDNGSTDPSTFTPIPPMCMPIIWCKYGSTEPQNLTFNWWGYEFFAQLTNETGANNTAGVYINNGIIFTQCNASATSLNLQLSIKFNTQYNNVFLDCTAPLTGNLLYMCYLTTHNLVMRMTSVQSHRNSLFQPSAFSTNVTGNIVNLSDGTINQPGMYIPALTLYVKK